jgi:hypothetical protein
MKALPLALALCIPALALSAQATALRCNHDLVEVGDSAAQLLLTCGEPLMRQTIATDNTSKTEGIVEQWTYSFGPGTFLQVVTIEGGKVALIEDGDRQ